MLWSLRRSPWFLKQSHMICYRPRASCYKGPRFLLQSPIGFFNRATWFLQQSHMAHAAEPHVSWNRDIWFLQKIPWFPQHNPTVPTSECHGSCIRDIWFLQQSHMVPVTETYGSCNGDIWFLQKSPMVSVTETYGSCKRSHGSRYRAPRYLHHNAMVPAREWLELKIPRLPLQSPTVPTECHDSCSRDKWILLIISHGSHCSAPRFLHESVMVPATETNGSCNRDTWFLQQSHMVPATETYGSCNKATWFLQQSPRFLQESQVVPERDLMVSATETHSSCIDAQLFLQQSSMVPTTKLHDSFEEPVVSIS